MTGRFTVPASLAFIASLAACTGSPDALAPDARAVDVPVLRSVDDGVCQFRTSAITVTLSAPTVAVGGSVDASYLMMGWHDNVLDLRVSWSSSNGGVARVEDGKVIGVAPGTTQIHAQCADKRGSATITVTEDTPDEPTAKTVVVTFPSSSVGVGETIIATAVLQQPSVQAAASVAPNDSTKASASVSAASVDPTWVSSNPAVARVDWHGQVTGVAAGVAKITAAIDGVSGSADITVASTTTPTTPPPTQPPVTNPPDGTGVRAALPELPRRDVPDAAFVPSSGRTIRVPSGGDLQSAINEARPGDQVLLPAGAQYVGNFSLPPKTDGETCSAWVTITTETSLPPAGTRVTPSSAGSFARIASPNWDGAIKTVGRGSCYRIVGVEITVLSSWTGLNYGIAMLGEDWFTSNSQIPHGIVLDRVYIHGQPTTNTMRCVALNTARSAIINSWITDCHGRNLDSQAIVGWNGPGPYLIENNFLAGGSENIMFGGADPRTVGLSPSDITIRRNHIWKDPSWKGVWVAKNLIELKHAKRVLIEDNVMENNWAEGQSGMAIVLKTLSDGGRAPWTQTADVTIRYNIIRNAPRGFNVQGMDGSVGTPVARVRLEHNLFENIGTYNGTDANGWLNLITHTPQDIAIVHNTMTHNTSFGISLFMDYGNSAASRLQVDDNVFTNPHGYALHYSGMAVGSASLTAMAGSSWSYSRNLTVGVEPIFRSMHPSASFYTSMGEAGFVNPGGGDYRLGSGSAYRGKASDGRDPGVDFDELNRRTTGVVVR